MSIHDSQTRKGNWPRCIDTNVRFKSLLGSDAREPFGFSFWFKGIASSSLASGILFDVLLCCVSCVFELSDSCHVNKHDTFCTWKAQAWNCCWEQIETDSLFSCHASLSRQATAVCPLLNIYYVYHRHTCYFLGGMTQSIFMHTTDHEYEKTSEGQTN